jgi:hypothetical protein
MTKQYSPFFCQSAAGSIAPGLTTRRTRGVAYLQRQPLLLKARTARQKTAASYLTALAGAWTYYRTLIAPGWAAQPDFHNQDAYHNYIAANMARRACGLWPTLYYPPNPASTPVNAGGSGYNELALAMDVKGNDPTWTPRAYCAWAVSLTSKADLLIEDVQWWQWTRQWDVKYKVIKPIAAGTYYLRYKFVNLYGVAGTYNQKSGITVFP